MRRSIDGPPGSYDCQPQTQTGPLGENLEDRTTPHLGVFCEDIPPPSTVGGAWVPEPVDGRSSTACQLLQSGGYDNVHCFTNLDDVPFRSPLLYSVDFKLPRGTCNNTPTPSLVQAIEFSMSRYRDGRRWEWALQLENVGESPSSPAPRWRVWRPSDSSWQPIGIDVPRDLCDGDEWRTLQMRGAITPDDRIDFISFAIDGVDQTPMPPIPDMDSVERTGEPHRFAAAVQIDSNFAGDPYTVYVDKLTLTSVEPPELTSTDPASPANDNDPKIQGSAPPGTTVTLHTDASCKSTVAGSGAAAAFASPGLAVHVDDDTTTTFYAVATDGVGNPSACSTDSIAYTEDSITPQTTLTATPPSPASDRTPRFEFASDEPATFECRLGADDPASCSSPHTPSSLEDGTHTFCVRAVDAAGNRDASPACHTFTVDTTPPDTSLHSGPPDPTDDPTPTFEFSSSEPSSTFTCRVDGGDEARCTSPHTVTALADGPHTLCVRATDTAGNADASPACDAITVDTTPPDTTLVLQPPEPTSDATPVFAFASSEAGSSFTCAVDAQAATGCGSPHTSDALSDGAHAFCVRATDAAGNPDPTPACRTFTVDTSAPTTLAGPGPPDPTNDATPTFEFSSSEPGSTFRCRVDAGAESGCGSPHTTAALADGVHAWCVRAVDPAGNPDPAPACRRFTVDTTPPDTMLVSRPRSPTPNPRPTFEFNSNEPGATFACRFDASEAACTSPHRPATPLINGEHVFEVRATDRARNRDPAAVIVRFMVQRIRPGCGANLIVLTARSETKRGSARADSIWGRGGNDTLLGLAGDDCIDGEHGNDRLNGGDGSDRMYGGAGNDRLAGGHGSDRLDGGAGRDRLTDRSGRDRLIGGAGSDRLDARDSRQAAITTDVLDCGPGFDVAYVDRRERAIRGCERVRRRGA